MITIEQLHSEAGNEIALGALLIEAVADNAGVSFLHPLSPGKARAFWRASLAEAKRQRRIVLGAFDSGELVGTVTLNLDMPENQPHRGDIAKMIVARRVRRRGIGTALLRAAEEMARTHGRTLLVLDTVTSGPARKLYEKLGWTYTGDIPDYALYSNRSGYSGTSIYYRRLT